MGLVVEGDDDVVAGLVGQRSSVVGSAVIMRWLPWLERGVECFEDGIEGDLGELFDGYPFVVAVWEVGCVVFEGDAEFGDERCCCGGPELFSLSHWSFVS